MKISNLDFPANVTVKVFDSRDALTEALSELLQEQLSSAHQSKGNASIALSGGRTPLPLFKRLSEMKLAWADTHVFLVDDRWLDSSHNDSNERLIRENLLQNQAKDAKFSGYFIEGKTAYDGVDDCNTLLSPLANSALDVVILGMGNDGHTASLFPCADGINDALESTSDCVAMTPQTAPYDRMSMTPKRILNSQLRILHACGDDKLETLSRALAGDQVSEMPIRLFLNEPLTIYWAP